MVVVVPPFLGEDSRLHEAPELLDVEELVAQTRGEGFLSLGSLIDFRTKEGQADYRLSWSRDSAIASDKSMFRLVALEMRQ